MMKWETKEAASGRPPSTAATKMHVCAVPDDRIQRYTARFRLTNGRTRRCRQHGDATPLTGRSGVWSCAKRASMNYSRKRPFAAVTAFLSRSVRYSTRRPFGRWKTRRYAIGRRRPVVARSAGDNVGLGRFFPGTYHGFCSANAAFSTADVACTGRLRAQTSSNSTNH